MTNKEFTETLEKRTIKFAIDILNFSTSLPKTPESLVLKNQLSKSGTSIGAIYREPIDPEVRKILKIKLKLV